MYIQVYIYKSPATPRLTNLTTTTTISVYIAVYTSSCTEYDYMRVLAKKRICVYAPQQPHKQDGHNTGGVIDCKHIVYRF